MIGPKVIDVSEIADELVADRLVEIVTARPGIEIDALAKFFKSTMPVRVAQLVSALDTAGRLRAYKWKLYGSWRRAAFPAEDTSERAKDNIYRAWEGMEFKSFVRPWMPTLGEQEQTYVVAAKCDYKDKHAGAWYCAHHDETFRNSMEKDFHITDRDHLHTLVWICVEHGPEVP